MLGGAPVRFDQLPIAEPTLPDDLCADLEQAVGHRFVSTEPLDRVVHGRGKSLRDLIRQRRGDLPRLPDVVVRPGSEEEVTATVQAALRADAVLIPFGGGSSISGSLQAPDGESRPVVSVDLERLDRVLEVDGESRLARVQAGVFGPHLEEQLGALGYTFGHFPDSFPHSTLGGWIATRSSGMQSDRYGDIADMVKGLRVVTPSGTLVTRPVPAASNGPSVRQMVLGSEGRLGIITEAIVHVRRIPDERTILGYLFPTFADGLAAMRDLSDSEYSASVTRVSDANETQFSFAMRVNPDARRQAAIGGAQDLRAPAVGIRSRADVPVVHRLRGQPAPRRYGSVARSEGSSSATAGCASARARACSTTRRSSTPRTSATSCSTAARPATCRRPRRRGAT